jgi:dTDP-4-amino-4,6-dideoxygalactose transaminase
MGALELAGVELVEVKDLLACPFEGIAAILATDQGASRHDAQALRRKCDGAGILYMEDTGWIPGFTAPHGDPSIADIQIISFGPGKPIPVGEGGALMCRSRSVYEKAISLSQHPERSITEGIFGSSRPLLNARMHPVSAILGIFIITKRNGGLYES